MKQLTHFLAVSAIILLSFFCYSSNFYPLLSSDDAIQILMIHNFHLPHDLYFWGQDRYGSLIPLIGQVFYRGFGISPLTSESLTHYLILIAGYFAFAGMFKSKYSQVLLAVVWFFPPFRLVDFLRGNIGLEYSLLAISIFMIQKIQTGRFTDCLVKLHLLLVSITLLFVLSVWVSDLAVVSIFLLLLIQVYFGVGSKNSVLNNPFKWKPGIYYFIAGIILGSAFIVYAKYNADNSPLYINFNDFSTIFESLKLFGNSMLELLLFRSNEPFTSAHLYLAILLTGILFLFRADIRFGENQKKWFLFFVSDIVLIFLVIMVSKWSFMNGVPRRYFTGHYIVFWMAFLFAFEYLAESKIKKTLRLLLMLTVLMAGAGGLLHMKYIWPKSLIPRVEYMREFESLGKIGIIGDYWNSYINSVTNPDNIIATPNDLASVRNREMAFEVMKRDTFYIIRDGWMETFPDSMSQFGTKLYKNGDEFRLGDCFVCRYKK